MEEESRVVMPGEPVGCYCDSTLQTQTTSIIAETENPFVAVFRILFHISQLKSDHYLRWSFLGMGTQLL